MASWESSRSRWVHRQSEWRESSNGYFPQSSTLCLFTGCFIPSYLFFKGMRVTQCLLNKNNPSICPGNRALSFHYIFADQQLENTMRGPHVKTDINLSGKPLLFFVLLKNTNKISYFYLTWGHSGYLLIVCSVLSFSVRQPRLRACRSISQ